MANFDGGAIKPAWFFHWISSFLSNCFGHFWLSFERLSWEAERKVAEKTCNKGLWAGFKLSPLHWGTQPLFMGRPLNRLSYLGAQISPFINSDSAKPIPPPDTLLQEHCQRQLWLVWRNTNKPEYFCFFHPQQMIMGEARPLSRMDTAVEITHLARRSVVSVGHLTLSIRKESRLLTRLAPPL